MYLLMDCKILKVEEVKGTSLKSNWTRADMQVVTTDKGVFIDNLPGNKFSKKISYAEVGFRWSDFIGTVVKDCKIISYENYFWINKAV